MPDSLTYSQEFEMTSSNSPPTPSADTASSQPQELPQEAYEARKVYDGFVRVWHWLNALLVVALIVSGYLIGRPPPSIIGDPENSYVMGYTRLVHMAGSYVFCVMIFARFIWGFLGNKYAMRTFYIPVWSRTWTGHLWHQIKWFFLFAREPRPHVGADPITRTVNIVLFFIPTLVIIVTGFGMYAEAAGRDSWQYKALGWMSDLSSNTLDWHNLHRLAMWALIVYTIIHLHLVVLDELKSKGSVIGTMINGKRFFRKKTKAPAPNERKA